MTANALGAEFRRFENRDHEGKPARVDRKSTRLNASH